MNFGDIAAIVFRIVANLPAITDAINKVMGLYPELRNILANILPGVFGKTALPANASPAAAGGGKADGFNVEWLQQSLNTLDNAGLEVDGDYGELTRGAVRNFQKKHGLFEDGWAGLTTSAKLYDELAKRSNK